MDITNGFFLVRFQDLNDYNKVLVQGPWIIFGQYLTGHVKELCLSAVANLVSGDSIVAVKTPSGGEHREGVAEKRVDYGPWMLVERKGRRGLRDSQANGGGASGKGSLGSRFSPLITEDDSGVRDRGIIEGLSEIEGVSHAAEDIGNEEVRVNSKGVVGREIGKENLGLDGEVARKIGVSPSPLAGSILGYGQNMPIILGKGRVEGEPSSKALGKRLMEPGRNIQSGRDLESNFALSDVGPPISTAGASISKKGEAHGSRSIMANGIGSNGHNNGFDIGLNYSEIQNISKSLPNDFSKQLGVDMQSITPEKEGSNLVLNNPIFEGSAVKLDMNLLDPTHHSAVSFKENEGSKSLKGNKKNILVNTNKYFSVSKGRGHDTKAGNNRGGPSLNRSFKEKGGKLKKCRNFSYPFV
ncbi:hypothetical protein J1N35_004893 [Gossypium stocksii]|uniref:DUF4283 domain-containing protein n=1 Tax=Gossypium stocksii TaxID=47602 RepID=A0A9D3WEH8_9ROSI|nr:hypothetical protein J1N35_004893 [Gossypium stocksii]